MEVELASARTAVSEAEKLVSKTTEELRQKNEDLRMLEGAIRKQATELDALWAKVVALEATNAELEKVSANLLDQLLKAYLL